MVALLFVERVAVHLVAASKVNYSVQYEPALLVLQVEPFVIMKMLGVRVLVE